MARIPIQLDGVDDLLAFYAECKGVSYADVIRHAGKDIVYGAYRTVPMSTARGRSRFALLPGKGSARGRMVYVNLDRLEMEESSRRHRVFKKRKSWRKSAHLAKLKQYRIASPARGFAKSVFIPVFKSLGFTTSKNRPSPADADRFAKYRGGFSFFASARSPYSDGFKESVEQFRASRMGDLSGFSSATSPAKGASGNADFDVTVVEPALGNPAHSSWAASALSAGFSRAGAIIARDFRRIFSSPHPSKVQVDT